MTLKIIVTEYKCTTSIKSNSEIARTGGRMCCVLLIISVFILTCMPPSASFANQINYQELQEEPIETAYKKLASPGGIEWDEDEMTAGDIPVIISDMKWPLKAGVLVGKFNRYRTKGHRKHLGVDLVVAKGTPIYAVLDGIVEVVSNGGNGFRGYGKVVIINHSNKLWSLYSHCSAINVRIGQTVKQGQVIAAVGSTGRATTNHLHFEIRNTKGIPLDPMKYLPKDGALPSGF